MTTETIWGSLPPAKGLGEKKVLVKTLEDTDYAAVTYAQGGSIVTISELEKVDFALCTLMSSLTFTSGAMQTIVTTYSGNTFSLQLLRNASMTPLSGVVNNILISDTGLSGIAISGVLKIRAFIVGEARKGID